MFEAFFSDPDLIYRINVINSIDFYSLGFEMVRGETKAENMLQWLRKGEVADVLVTNVQCPDMSGFELAETVRKYCPRVRVIFLADTPNCVIAQQVVRFGAYDFLLKSDGIDALRAALSRAAEELCAERRENAYLRSQTNWDEIIPKLKAYTTGNVVDKVTCTEKKVLKGQGKRVALMDFGAKNNIAKSLNERGCEVTIYPAHTTAEEILGDNPDGIMLSNGPGDPKECVDIIKEIKKLYDSNVPIFAICLGHQLMALATGADTHKMKYGHRGGNHPVKDLATGRVYISSQNHGYVVDTDKLDPNVAEPAFINVNDGTNEGLKYVNKNIFTVQFHPEACPGPQDSAYLFDRFINMMGGNQ